MSSMSPRPRDFLQLSLATGLTVGLLEALIVTVARALTLELKFQGLQMAWMAPLAGLCFAALPATAGALVARRWPGIGWRIAVFGCVGIAAATLLLHVPGVARLSLAILAAGVGIQAARMSESNTSWRRWQRTVAFGAVAAVSLLAVVTSAGPALAERVALGQLPVAAGRRASVLLIVLDTVRAESLSAYGRQRPTSPGLDRLAAQGVRFERAFSTAPWTLPSHASLLTGRWPHELSTNWLSALDNAAPTLGEVLSGKGYATAAFSANFEYVSREAGLGRGFAHFDDYGVTPGQVVKASALGNYLTNARRLRDLLNYYQLAGRRSAEEVNARFLRWLDRSGERPVFAMLNFFDAHHPYIVPPPFLSRFGPNRAGEYSLSGEAARHSPDLDQAMVDDYESAIAYLDHNLSLLFEALAARGRLDDTIVVVTADHGEEFGEHGVYEHGHSLYRPSVQVPLIIRFPPKVPAGRQVSEPVSGRDVPATIMDLLDLSESPFPGRSLVERWSAAEVARHAEPVLSEVRFSRGLPTWFPVSKGDMRSVVGDGRRAILNGDGSIEIYDINMDPGERKDLASTPEGQMQASRLRALAGPR